MIQQTHHIGGGTRPAAAAGTHYPDNPVELRRTIANLISSANGAQSRGEIVPGHPKAIIAPPVNLTDPTNAAAGAVAARAYVTVEPMHATIQRVVLIGRAHHATFEGLVTASAETFDTPLGPVPVDRDAVRCLTELPEVSEDDRAHRAEHSLEVHLPFLFHVLGEPRAERGAGSGFRIVPLLVGQADDRQVIHALNRVWGGRETLIVVSADLARSTDSVTARQHDHQTIEHILNGKIELIGPNDASGHLAIRGLMRLTWAYRLYPRLLDLRHARDGASSNDELIGYASVVYS